jgi:hypothetical protein
VTSLMLIPLVVGLLVLTLLLIVGLGDGVRSRTQTRTSADAAALAAANAWREELARRYDQVLRAPDPGTALRALLATDPRTLAIDAAAAADEFAARNSGVVEARDLTADTTGLVFSVRTRSVDPAQQTGVYTHAEAAARAEITSPLCLSQGRFGLRDAAACLLPGQGLPAGGPLPIPATALAMLRTDA